jgi:ectoine hydroxylase-related dioxygenase (phytanoyl-CoA dioxygenase family)
VTSSTLTDFQPVSRGYKLDPNEFGFLEDSSAHIKDADYLRQKMADAGYLFLKGFFPRDEVLKARQEILDRFEEKGFLDRNHSSQEGVLANRIANERTAFAATAAGNEVINKFNPVDIIKGNQPLWDLLNEGRIMEFFGAFFGTPAHRFKHIWFRGVGRGMGTPPHCDWVYMSRGSTNLYTTWVTMGDTPVDVGGLMVLEGSHKKADKLKNYFSRDVDDYCTTSPNVEKLKSGEMMYEWDGVLTKNPYSLREKLGGRWLTAELYEAGDLLIFTRQTIHASLDNQTDRIRISVDTRYQPANEPSDARWNIDDSEPYDKRYKKGRIC